MGLGQMCSDLDQKTRTRGTKNNNRDLEHIYNWIRLFIYLYNSKIRNNILFKIGDEVMLS